jgi:ParB family chromosome partitioning protein
MGHAKALLQLSNPERRRHLRDRISRDGLSVRAAEALARSLAAPGTARTAKPQKKKSTGQGDPNLRSLIEQLESHLLTRVRIDGAEGHGRMEIHFHGPEELDRVARTILEGRRA